jgi:O-antigen ligase
VQSLVLAVVIIAAATRMSPLPDDVVSATLSEGSGNSLRQIVYGAAFFILLVASRPLNNPWKLVRVPLSLGVLLLWCIASLFWSIAPDVTLRRLILTIMMAWIVFRVVDDLGYRQVMRTVLYTCLALLMANYLAVAISPRAVHQGVDTLGDNSLAGNWRGIIPHKNGAGPLCAYTLILLAFGGKRIGAKLRIALFAAAAFFLIMTQSKTSVALVMVALGFGTTFLFYDPRRRSLLLEIGAVAAAMGVYAGYRLIPPYLESLASSQDAFTGRIQIWRLMAAYLNDHPYLGAGFGAFWNVPGSPVPHYTNLRWIIQQVFEGHNGYLDIWTQIGLAGMILAIVVELLLPIGKLLMFRSIPRRAGAIQFAVLIFALGHNFTESSLLATDQFMHVIVLLAIACIADMSRVRSRRREIGDPLEVDTTVRPAKLLNTPVGWPTYAGSVVKPIANPRSTRRD